mmetsp:Transcript_2910/g.11477  ORF Transcript_2910/g.11477 Transcript_2910/m.11477 type:complete len:209 (+) Transcript_2910:387-1013(+)
MHPRIARSSTTRGAAEANSRSARGKLQLCRERARFPFPFLRPRGVRTPRTRSWGSDVRVIRRAVTRRLGMFRRRRGTRTRTTASGAPGRGSGSPPRSPPRACRPRRTSGSATIPAWSRPGPRRQSPSLLLENGDSARSRAPRFCFARWGPRRWRAARPSTEATRPPCARGAGSPRASSGSPPRESLRESSGSRAQTSPTSSQTPPPWG